MKCIAVHLNRLSQVPWGPREAQHNHGRVSSLDWDTIATSLAQPRRGCLAGNHQAVILPFQNGPGNWRNHLGGRFDYGNLIRQWPCVGGWAYPLTTLWWMSQNGREAQSSSPCRHGHGGIRHRIPCFRMESATFQEQGIDIVHTALQALQLCPWGMLERPHLPHAILSSDYMQPVWWAQPNSVSNLELSLTLQSHLSSCSAPPLGRWMSFPNSVCQTQPLTFPRKSAPQQSSTWWQ